MSEVKRIWTVYGWTPQNIASSRDHILATIPEDTVWNLVGVPKSIFDSIRTINVKDPWYILSNSTRKYTDVASSILNTKYITHQSIEVQRVLKNVNGLASVGFNVNSFTPVFVAESSNGLPNQIINHITTFEGHTRLSLLHILNVNNNFSKMNSSYTSINAIIGTSKTMSTSCFY